MGKGDNRRPEDPRKIAANWPKCEKVCGCTLGMGHPGKCAGVHEMETCTVTIFEGVLRAMERYEVAPNV
jgi:hypothetical protein